MVDSAISALPAFFVSSCFRPGNASGNIYVNDQTANRILKISPGNRQDPLGQRRTPRSVPCTRQYLG